MWFCVNTKNGSCYTGCTPDEAWYRMEADSNIDIGDCEFYESSSNSPKTFTLKLTEVNPD